MIYFLIFTAQGSCFLFCLFQRPLEDWNEAGKRVKGESQIEKLRSAGGFIDLGKFLSILSTLLSESVGKIAPKVRDSAKMLLLKDCFEPSPQGMYRSWNLGSCQR